MNENNTIGRGEFLLEILSEEIPESEQKDGAIDLLLKLDAELKKANVALAKSETLGVNGERYGYSWGPRRIAVFFKLHDKPSQARVIEKRGPRVGSPQQAIDGFLRSVGGAKDDLVVEAIKGVDYYFWRREEPILSTKEILANILGQVLAEVRWKKTMRWGEGNATWVRPIRSILAVWSPGQSTSQSLRQVVDFEYAGVRSGSVTQDNHLIGLSAAELKFSVLQRHPNRQLNLYETYVEGLKQRSVIAGPVQRKNLIDKAFKALDTRSNHQKRRPVFDYSPASAELAGVVEFPVPIRAAIRDEMLDLPGWLIRASLWRHHKCHVLLQPDGRACKEFLFIANGSKKMIEAPKASSLKLNNIRAGVERVVDARLYDAKHFVERDLNAGLDILNDRLEQIIFHTRVGTVKDKVRRLEKLSDPIYQVLVPEKDSWSIDRDSGSAAPLKKEQLVKAVKYSKVDLASELVSEMPELQGLAGGYYFKQKFASADALGENDNSFVERAIADQYLPPSIRQDSYAAFLSILDAIDSLVAMWMIGEKPTGSRDPFALRRAGVNLITCLIFNKWPSKWVKRDQNEPPLKAMIEAAYQLLLVDIRRRDALIPIAPVSEVVAEIISFLSQRYLHTAYATKYRADIIFALGVGLGGPGADPNRFQSAVDGFLELWNSSRLGSNGVHDLAVLVKRIVNLLPAEDSETDAQLAASTNHEQDPINDIWLSLDVLEEQFADIRSIEMRALDVPPIEMPAINKLRHLCRLIAPIDSFLDSYPINKAELNEIAVRRTALRKFISLTKQIGRLELIQANYGGRDKVFKSEFDWSRN